MLTVYKEIDQKLTSREVEEAEILNIENNTWIDIKNPTIEILEKISQLTGIPFDLLNVSLDEEETAHIDDDEGAILLVLDTPFLENKETNHYSTAPFVIAYNDNYFITISRHEFELIPELFNKVKKIEPHKHVRLSLYFLYRLMTLFINYLKRIDTYSKGVEKNLNSSMKNQELFKLMDVSKTLVYFSTALNGNKSLLTKLFRMKEYKKFEDDFDLMEDVEIEMNQAIEMCTIYRGILASVTETYGSVISNNLNIVMKTLAIVTLVISVPTVIASFFGMNFKDIPLSDYPRGFWVTIVVSIVLSIVAGVVLVYYTRHTRNK